VSEEIKCYATEGSIQQSHLIARPDGSLDQEGAQRVAIRDTFAQFAELPTLDRRSFAWLRPRKNLPKRAFSGKYRPEAYDSSPGSRRRIGFCQGTKRFATETSWKMIRTAHGIGIAPLTNVATT